VSSPIQDIAPAPKSAPFAFTPITLIALLALFAVWLGCGFYGIEDYIKIRVAVSNSVPMIYLSLHAYIIGVLVGLFIIAPLFVALSSIGKMNLRGPTGMAILFSLIFLFFLGFTSPIIVLSAMKSSFSNLAAAHGYEVCATDFGKFRNWTLFLPSAVENGACSNGTIYKRL
jgi:hypothetical protein